MLMLKPRFLIICELKLVCTFHGPPNAGPHSWERSPVAGTENGPSELLRFLLRPKNIPTNMPRRRLKNGWLADPLGGIGIPPGTAPGARLTLTLPLTWCE